MSKYLSLFTYFFGSGSFSFSVFVLGVESRRFRNLFTEEMRHSIYDYSNEGGKRTWF